MKELNDIVSAYDKAVLQNKQMVLATVVRVDGSSYRRPGARMLVTDDSKITGAISGGCLEGDALEKALFAMATGENKLITYDSTGEDDIQFGLHLGCNGVVHILFEPIKKKIPKSGGIIATHFKCRRRSRAGNHFFDEKNATRNPAFIFEK